MLSVDYSTKGLSLIFKFNCFWSISVMIIWSLTYYCSTSFSTYNVSFSDPETVFFAFRWSFLRYSCIWRCSDHCLIWPHLFDILNYYEYSRAFTSASSTFIPEYPIIILIDEYSADIPDSYYTLDHQPNLMFAKFLHIDVKPFSCLIFYFMV